MARKLRIEYPGATYHVMNRGIDRRVLFRNERDYRRFETALGGLVELHQVLVHAYCLLPNHFHLLVETPRGNLSRFMQALQTRYGVYFNRKYGRSGHVFQGPYKAILVEDGEYVLKLSRYIHLNPVRTSAFKDCSLKDQIAALRRYRWSSYGDYIRPAKRRAWLSCARSEDNVASMFGTKRHGYRTYVEAGLRAEGDEMTEMLREGLPAIGSDEYLERIHSMYQDLRGKGKRKQEDAADWKSSKVATPARILQAVLDGLEIGKQDLTRRRGGGLYRAIAAILLQKYGGMTQREVADHLGVTTGAAISMQRKALTQRLTTDAELRRIMVRIEAELMKRNEL